MGIQFLRIGLVLLLSGCLLRGNPFQYLAGTTFEDGAGQDYAYLVWQAEDLALLQNTAYELYEKSGGAGSGAAYTRRGRLQLVSKASIISALLSTSPTALGNLSELETTVDDLFGQLLPDGLTLAEKLSGLLQAARSDLAVFERLYFLSRSEPLLGVLLGTAALVPMPSSAMTYELRAQGNGQTQRGQAFDQVIGRVSVSTASPAVIPAPSAPVEVEETSPQGHLSARLRWDESDDLKRLAPLLYGYSVYRISKEYAEGKGYPTSPPSPSELAQLLAAEPDKAVQVNELPVMIPANAEDPSTFFVLDNNKAFDGGVPFTHGEAYYYFIAAADLLGRPGNLSDGTLVTICDRMPPKAPRKVSVSNDYTYNGSVTQRLKVRWEAPANADSEPPSHYVVYRWDNPEQILQAASPNTPDPVGSVPIPHVPGQSVYEWIDRGGGAPSVPDDLGKTFWYTVRTLEHFDPSEPSPPCGPLISGDSAPAYGVLRDREGPPMGPRTMSIQSYGPRIELVSEMPLDLVNYNTATFLGEPGNAYAVVLELTRTSPHIERVTLSLAPLAPPSGETPQRVVVDHVFPDGVNDLTVGMWIPEVFFSSSTTNGLLLGAFDDRGQVVYAMERLDDIDPKEPDAQVFELNLNLVAKTVTFANGVSSETNPVHDPIVPGDPNAIQPVTVTFVPSATSREYKLYKRIAGGELLLVEQQTDETVTALPIVVEDNDLPANGAEVCYFLQYFDEHGNPSPLMPLGCFRSSGRVQPPLPSLADIESLTDTPTNPRVRLKWFCPSEGVERFHIFLSDGATRLPQDFGDDVEPVLSDVAVEPVPPETEPVIVQVSGSLSSCDGQLFRAYQTGRVGGNFGDPSTPGEYEVTLNVRPGTNYRVYIESVSPTGHHSAPTQVGEFVWSLSPESSTAQVPWPARSLPPVIPKADFNAQIKAQYLETDYINPGSSEPLCAAVRIGKWEDLNEVFKGSHYNQGAVGPDEMGQGIRTPTVIYNTDDFRLSFYESTGGETVFPCVLYRYQVPSVLFPDVSGDVVQVTPLIDRMRTVEGTNLPGDPVLEIHDPFIDVLVDPDQPGTATEVPDFGIYVRDTQGVVKGASYVYLLVRFREDGEIDRVIKTNTVNIPAS